MEKELFTTSITERQLQDLIALKATNDYPAISLEKVSCKEYQLECHEPNCDKTLSSYLEKVLPQDTCKAIIQCAYKGYCAHYLEEILEHIEVTLKVNNK